MKTKDVYDLEVERLSKLSQDDIFAAWCWDTTAHSPLFDAAKGQHGNNVCLCLTQIKYHYADGNTDDAPFISKHLDRELRNDPLIPSSATEIKTVKQLRRFAFWQRRLDRYFRRKPPEAR